MAEMTFKDDLIDGEMKEYFPSGKHALQTDYKNGILNGSRMSYYESGIGKIEEYYKDGKKNGKSFEYYDNGNTKENSYYQRRRQGRRLDDLLHQRQARSHRADTPRERKTGSGSISTRRAC